VETTRKEKIANDFAGGPMSFGRILMTMMFMVPKKFHKKKHFLSQNQSKLNFGKNLQKLSQPSLLWAVGATDEKKSKPQAKINCRFRLLPGIKL